MKPRGPLMIEHRLIEKMLELVRERIDLIDTSNSIDPVFIDTTVDFIRTYADLTHHGKEEDIMFKVLAKKAMSLEDQKIMKELVEEHTYGRQVVGELCEAKERYIGGHAQALQIIKEKLCTLCEFYPDHIAKEDKIFFPNSERYMSEQEREVMLKEFWEFDRQMIHTKYRSVVEHLKIHQDG